MLHGSTFILIPKQPYNIHSHISDFMSRPAGKQLRGWAHGAAQSCAAPSGAFAERINRPFKAAFGSELYSPNQPLQAKAKEEKPRVPAHGARPPSVPPQHVLPRGLHRLSPGPGASGTESSNPKLEGATRITRSNPSQEKPGLAKLPSTLSSLILSAQH